MQSITVAYKYINCLDGNTCVNELVYLDKVFWIKKEIVICGKPRKVQKLRLKIKFNTYTGKITGEKSTHIQ